jgi:hypothetical protein
MSTLSPNPKFRAFDSDGNPLSGGKLYTYSAGTTTPLATYTDSTEVTSNTNPVILDSDGEANLWLGESLYKMVLKDSNDVTQWTVDNVSSSNYTVKVLRDQLATANGSGMVGFSHDSTYTDGTVGEKLKQVVSVKDEPFNVQGDGTDEYTVIKEVWDYCLANGFDLYFPAGTYSCGIQNFPWKQDFPASTLLDCKNITIYGEGPTTIFKTDSVTGADVFNAYSVKNLHARNFAIEAEISNTSGSGSNGISVVGGFDNLTFDHVWINDLPYTDKITYLDGGKAFTIQTGTPATECGTLKATNIFAKGCVHGFGLEVDLANWAEKKHSVEIDIVAENCYQGVVFSAGEATSALNADMTMGVTVNATLVNCQRDVVIARSHGMNVDATVVTTKTAADRRLNPSGTAWTASDTIVDSLQCTYAKNSRISVSGDKGECDYKVQIGGSSVGSSGLNGHTESCQLFFDIGGTSSIIDVLIITASAVFTLQNNNIVFSYKMVSNPASLPSGLFTPSLSNIITIGSIPRFNDLLVAGALKLTQTDGVTSYTKLNASSNTIYASQNFSSSTSAKIFGFKDHTDSEKVFVRNDGALGLSLYGAASAFSTPVKVIPVYKEDNTLMGYIPVYSSFTP